MRRPNCRECDLGLSLVKSRWIESPPREKLGHGL